MRCLRGGLAGVDVELMNGKFFGAWGLWSACCFVAFSLMLGFGAGWEGREERGVDIVEWCKDVGYLPSVMVAWLAVGSSE